MKNRERNVGGDNQDRYRNVLVIFLYCKGTPYNVQLKVYKGHIIKENY